MKIRAAKVNWYEGYSNKPRLQVLVDELPPREEMIFKRKKRLYLAELDGYVRYFAWSGEGNDGGHYRRSFPIKVEEDGEVKDVTLLGPWSSRAGVMNQFFERCVDVSITDDPVAFERGHTFMAGTITLEKAMKAADMILGVVLVRAPDDDEPVWIPAKVGYSSHGNWAQLSRILELERERENDEPSLDYPDDTPAIWICYSRREALRYVVSASEWERIDDPDQSLTVEEGWMEGVTEIPIFKTDKIVHEDGDGGYLLLRLGR